jgi:hypothetical protein
MLLWARPIPKKLRLHDTRHTTATLLEAPSVRRSPLGKNQKPDRAH